MNAILELRWKISMLEMMQCAATHPHSQMSADEGNRARAILRDMHAALRVEEQFAAQGKLDAERMRRMDEEKAKP